MESKIQNNLVSFIVLATALLLSLWYVYANYHEVIYEWIGVRTEFTIFIDSVFLTVTVADERHERWQGLSGTDSLPDQTGMLFIFDEPGYYGMVMRDMNYPLDMLWINNDLQVVHIEKNTQPESNEVFKSPVPARFVLEVPAFTTDSFKIEIGDQLYLPPEITPEDLQEV